MPPLKDLTGQKFGKLTVIKRGKTKNRHTYWTCLCECGNELDIRADALSRNITTSCGYCTKNKTIDITGQKFGKLTVLQNLQERDNQGVLLWLCQCECGRQVKVRGTALRYGSNLSCGDPCCKGVKKDIIGQRFGKLVVVKESNYKSPHHNNTYWECLCDCGNSIIVNGSYLRTGMTTSCGCINSKGEEKITTIFIKNNKNFVKQKTFETCRFEDTNALARFDFYVDNKYLIEFDGVQHFKFNNRGWDTEEKFQKTQEHDEYKNQWCKENNIPLIRIPYTKLNTLCLEDLLLETTQFRVV